MHQLLFLYTFSYAEPHVSMFFIKICADVLAAGKGQLEDGLNVSALT